MEQRRHMSRTPQSVQIFDCRKQRITCWFDDSLQSGVRLACGLRNYTVLFATIIKIIKKNLTAYILDYPIHMWNTYLFWNWWFLTLKRLGELPGRCPKMTGWSGWGAWVLSCSKSHPPQLCARAGHWLRPTSLLPGKRKYNSLWSMYIKSDALSLYRVLGSHYCQKILSSQ